MYIVIMCLVNCRTIRNQKETKRKFTILFLRLKSVYSQDFTSKKTYKESSETDFTALATFCKKRNIIVLEHTRSSIYNRGCCTDFRGELHNKSEYYSVNVKQT